MPYDGPYTVSNRKDKTFDLEINGKIVTVTIDRLKPAYTISEEIFQEEVPSRQQDLEDTQAPTEIPAENIPSEKKNRFNRRVRFTERHQAGFS